MKNQFLDLVSSPLMNIDHTYRYSGTKLVESESLSQHIVDTIMLGIKIIDEINNIPSLSEGNLLSPEVYVMKAVYHDMEEVITGDIPRPLKYYNEDTLKSMRDVADKIAVEFFDSQFSKKSHYEIWRDAKSGDEGFILKIVDMLVVVNKVVKEVSLLNNFYMLRVAHEVSQYLAEYKIITHFTDYRVNKYLESIIEGAIESMNDILDSHGDCMDKLNLCAQSMI